MRLGSGAGCCHGRKKVRELHELLNPIVLHANVSERWLWQLHAKNKIKSMSLVLITTSPTGGSKL